MCNCSTCVTSSTSLTEVEAEIGFEHGAKAYDATCYVTKCTVFLWDWLLR